MAEAPPTFGRVVSPLASTVHGPLVLVLLVPDNWKVSGSRSGASPAAQNRIPLITVLPAAGNT